MAQKKESSVLQTIVDIIPYYIVWKNNKQVIVGCNRMFANQFGYKDPKSVIGKTDYEFPWPEDLREKYLHDERKVIVTGIAKLNYEEQQRQSDGSYKTVLVSKVPMYDDTEKITGILVIYTDITERKNQEKELLKSKERAEAANEAKKEFLYNMRHDIRTPFSGILGVVQMMIEEESDPAKKENLNMISQSAQHLLDYLNEILEFAQIDTGMMPVLAKPFDLSEVFNGIIESMALAAKEKRLELVKNFNVPREVIGDKFRLERILINLVSNAIKFTSTGHVTLSAFIAEEKKRDLILCFVVEDTGMGIPEEKYNTVFEQFNRLTSSYSGVYKGIGLGLKAVKQLSEELGGEIRVDSEVGSGSRFICLLPFKRTLVNNLEDVILSHNLALSKESHTSSSQFLPKTQQSKATTKAVPMESASVSEAGPYVLLIEDNAIARKVGLNILRKLNCTVDVATTGEAAVELMTDMCYDLVFVDIGLPGISGYEVVQIIRNKKNDPKIGAYYATVPMIAITAQADEKERKEILACGMTKILIKPMTQDVVKDLFNTLLSGNVFAQTGTPAHSIASIQSFDKKETTAPIDLELGAKVMGSSKEMVIEMLSLLVRGIPEQKNNLKKALEKKDWSQFIAVVHKLHGGCSYCGVPRLQLVSHDVEDKMKSGQTDRKQVEAFYKELVNAMNDVINAYQQLSK